MKTLISDAFDETLPDKIKKYGEVTEDRAQATTADIILVRSKTKCNKEYIDAAKNVRLIIRGGVGLDNIDVSHAQSRGIIVKNTAAASSIAVAELAFALMIALPNHIITGHNSTVSGQWIKKEIKRTELYGKTLGIIGCGRIGQQMAKRATAFGMSVIGCDTVDVKSEYIRMEKSIKDFLPKCDYISLHLPLTDTTRGMINKDIIARMKDGVRIINSGRGKTVVEDDLVEGLKSGKIAAYATDVYYADPPAGSPLLTAPNVLLSPHIGATTKENMLRIGEMIDELIGQFVAGKLS